MSLREEAGFEIAKHQTRRYFLRKSTLGLGAIALASLQDQASLTGISLAKDPVTRHRSPATGHATRPPHFVPKAKRVIYLYMAGAPSQLELFDYKPKLAELDGQACPESLLEGKNFAFIQGTPKMLGPQATFKRYGQSGAYVSDRLPHFSSAVDEVSFLKAVYTDEFNHAPGQLLMLTGSSRLGRPSMGSWVIYGLGSENDNLPGFVVLLSGENHPDAGKAAWGSGFLPTIYQGVQCRSEGDPVLYASNPEGVTRDLRRRALDAINRINQRQYEEIGDPETLTRIAQYEMAFRMQVSVPEVMDITREPEYIHEMYGTRPGETSFANNCLLARRLIERGVRFVQLFDWGWDSHGTNEKTGLKEGFVKQCQAIDRPMTALIQDLRQRGLLEETLIIWGGEFGRTPMLENRAGKDNPFVGRDHHSDAFTMWLAGGGIRQGFSFGETDDVGYIGVKDRVHVHDLQATILNLLGMDHEKLTYHFQGRDFRLTDVHGNLVEEILA
ncbi:MAG: DUF1501 domain-containing protein [Acidobacteriota bacterium]